MNNNKRNYNEDDVHRKTNFYILNIEQDDRANNKPFNFFFLLF